MATFSWDHSANEAGTVPQFRVPATGHMLENPLVAPGLTVTGIAALQ
jgi:hypothetical protein